MGRAPCKSPWIAWLAGGPQRPLERAYYEELQRRVRELGIDDRVRFLGQRRDVPELMVSADMFCQPNTGPEPFGVVFIEALLAGLPVVTSDIGGARESINASCGVLTKPNDPASVARAIGALLANPSERQRLGKSGPDRARSLCDPARQLQATGSAIFNSTLARL